MVALPGLGSGLQPWCQLDLSLGSAGCLTGRHHQMSHE
uniref:Non-SMC condensin II complex subunit D3 n=1 Tax=Microcebus murinus TaxID=30608 RepID=A0A8C5VBA0_MICMU